MACYKPLKAWRGRQLSLKTGKFPMVFKLQDSNATLICPPIMLPCGRCVGCRLQKSKEWAIRCVHESSLHTSSAFVTLTYDDTNLPIHHSLKLRDYQLFMKRLRRDANRPKDNNIRFYAAGEYGEDKMRPHYHALLFNIEFPDKKFLTKQNDVPIYTSDLLSSIWGKGFCSIGDVTMQSAAYVARYVMKKATGEHAEQKYNHTDQYGEIHQIEPERATMSRKPGIASHWFQKYRTDLYPDDFVIINGRKHSTPKFYDRQMQMVDPKLFSRLQFTRKKSGRRRLWDETPDRLAVREKLAHIKIDQLPRNLGKGKIL